MNTPPSPAEYTPPPADILPSSLPPIPAPEKSPESTVADTPANPEPQQETPQEVSDMFFINAAALLEEMKQEEQTLPAVEEQERTIENQPETMVDIPLHNPHQWDF